MQEHWVVQVYVPDGEGYGTEMALHSVWDTRWNALDAAARAKSDEPTREPSTTEWRSNRSGYAIGYEVYGKVLGGKAHVQLWEGEKITHDEQVLCQYSGYYERNGVDGDDVVVELDEEEN